MYLTYRPAALDDLPACIDMAPEPFKKDHDLLRALPEVWNRWLSEGEMQMTVLEDEERPAHARTVAFGCSIFVTDEIARLARTSLAPPVTIELIKRAGDRPPQLTLEQIRQANAGAGLRLLVLAIGWSNSIVDPDYISRIKAKLVEAFHYTHAGYKIEEFLQEVYSTTEMERALAIGAYVRTDYARFYNEMPPTDSERPYLVGASRDDVREGSYVWPIFLTAKRRLDFTPGEQEILKRALIDQTDAEIATALNISISTVHKRWQSLFDRAAESNIRWLPIEEPTSDQRRGRGVEKRRHLLAYIRCHPEELRPIASEVSD
jgi:hypothetical protein